MKIIKTKNYKEAMQEVSFQQIYNDALKRYNGDKKQAAEVVLDIATSGTWAGWDQERIDSGIQTILKQFDI